MQMPCDDRFHLTYCTNIHAGETWAEVLAGVQRYAPVLKQRLSPDSPFGLGLRLSAQASDQLLQGDALSAFRRFLDENGCYVALINGFPFGAFHGQVIKQKVFTPDWWTEERTQYTLRLVEILKHLLPPDLDGGISTSPLSYKAWVGAQDNAAWVQMTRNIARIAEAMLRVREESGKWLHLDIEPEPDGLIENSGETVAFYQDWLLPLGGEYLVQALGVSADRARAYLRDHIQICFDTCHFAVEYEAPDEALARFAAAGIRIGRFQISSALKVPLPADRACRDRIAEQLSAFAESTYLHQVIEQRVGEPLHHYSDLTEALPHIHDAAASQWRIHFHVPLFMEEYELFGSTQQDILALFPLLRECRISPHLEIETYTWEVLPPPLKLDLVDSIEREYRWVLAAFPG